ncbi:MAG: F0F1 ATP synthase subunit gamma, partial [Chthoniobacterales bacterium]
MRERVEEPPLRLGEHGRQPLEALLRPRVRDREQHDVARVEAELRAEGGGGRPLLIVITADRGLCGSFNSNVIKAAGQFILKGAPGRDIALGLIGRKGRDFFRRRGFDVRYEAVGIFQKMTFGDASDIADAAIEEFTSGAASS